MHRLLEHIQSCRVCENYLKDGVRPVVAAGPESKIMIIGQAPGRKVHESGIPWNDKSGDNLRTWLGIDKAIFYDSSLIAIMPMGFCFPGKGKTGDLPPRPECAPLWHQKLLEKMPEIKLTLLIGQYAQQYYLRERTQETLTETVRNFKDYLPEYFPLPHPSPRNNIWQRKNSWFTGEVLPELKARIEAIGI
jgi:uracil-DNA glycosylase family 4